jgi:SAM-dependent methyltransferase
MLGQRTAALERPPRRWVQRLWGHPYLATRQDWRALWPMLAALPQRGLRVLDAGCGPGRWTLELAARRPEWRIVGLDRDLHALRAAERARRRLGLANAAFVGGDLADFRAARPFDLVLSVCSAHYLAEAGRAEAPFRSFAACLAPGGRLVFFGPRRLGEAPFVDWLPRPEWHAVFARDELVALCAGHGLAVERIAGRIGRLGTVAQQLDRAATGRARRVALAGGLYAVEWLLAAADGLLPARAGGPTLMWLVVARAGQRGA